MAAESITLGNGTIWSGSSSGTGWMFTPSSITQIVIEEKSPLGSQYWVKCNGKNPAVHSLELSWFTSNIRTIYDNMITLMSANLLTLTVPGWGSFTNCRISNINDWKTIKADGSNYNLFCTIEITQYPSS